MFADNVLYDGRFTGTLESGYENVVSRALHINSEFDGLNRASLPDDLGNHLTEASVNAENTLIVVCASAAWAARLRFHADALLAEARRGGFPAARCRVRARPARP